MTKNRTTPETEGVFKALLPIMASVFIAFLIIGMALPVLPLRVHNDLHFSPFVVGLVTGCQFVASLISRVWAGHYSDSKGASRAVMAGLLGACVAGAFYLVSLLFSDTPPISVSILIAGRAILGGAESFIITGALAWGLSSVNAIHAGKVISWVGTAMYLAFAVGAPLGTLLYSVSGFLGIALATLCFPLIALAMVTRLPRSLPAQRQESDIRSVLSAVCLAGIGLAFSSLGFGAITTFVVLDLVQLGWQPAWLGFSIFAIAFIATRLMLGHLPDRLGGPQTALVSILIEAIGLALLGYAPNYAAALIGSFLTGAGYALVYPGLGLAAVERAPAESRGLAMGTYTAFLDVALGIATPLLGLFGGHHGLPAIFRLCALIVLVTVLITILLMRAPKQQA